MNMFAVLDQLKEESDNIPELRVDDFDQLTGALTIRAFSVVSQQLTEHRIFEEMPSVIFTNIERFKTYNERYGYESGNELLQGLGDILSMYFPERLIGRYGPDQFVILLEDHEVYPNILRVNSDFRDHCLDMPLNLKFGICRYEDPAMNINAVCDRAKIACDSLRKRPGQTYRYFDEELQEMTIRKQHIVENLDKAVEKGYIRAFYQPVIRTLTNEVCGMEALVRWDDPVYGLLSPDEFISALEETHLISKLDTRIVELVCQDYAENLKEGRTAIPVSFNLSRMDFELQDMFEEIQFSAEKYHVPKNMLKIEITESILARDPEIIKAQIKRFHDAGYEVWMDDFGSGYSSVNSIKFYDFDLIKLDMGLLRNFNDKSRKIISSIVDMIKKIGMRTLAEGIETNEQLDFLREIGCERIQGYYVGRPAPLKVTVDRLIEKGYHFEKPEKRAYNDALGDVNLLSYTPLSYSSGKDDSENEDESHGIPLAIVESRDGRANLLYQNRSFRTEILSFGLTADELTGGILKYVKGTKPGELQDFVRKLENTSETLSCDLYLNGHYCTVRGRKISEVGGLYAFLITLLNMSGNSLIERSTRRNDVLNALYRIYDFVALLYPEENQIMALYWTDPSDSDHPDETRPELNFHNYEDYIAEPDREKCREFFDLTTLPERIAKSDKQVLRVQADIRFSLSDPDYWPTDILISSIDHIDSESYVIAARRRDSAS